MASMKGHGESWQYSGFFCILKDIDRVRMQSALEEVLNLEEDQAMILDLGADEAKAREAATVLGPATVDATWAVSVGWMMLSPNFASGLPFLPDRWSEMKHPL